MHVFLQIKKKRQKIILGTEYLMLETNDLFYRYFVLHRNYETNFPPFVVACSE
jgi:hypothetical protein